MSRLETEINQIYLTHPESKKCFLILYEEAISNSAHLFVLAELKDLQRKSESQDLKKISEIILESFRANKKLSGESLFESALSQINQNLADLAHEGHKSWVGKFSCLIGLKAADNIFLANNGQTQAFLLRKSELVEILSAEKRGMHPLKSFANFTQGKLQQGDALVITTSNIFNFVSLELFSQIISDNSLTNAATEISKILQESMAPELGFSAFLLGFGKKSVIAEPEVAAPIYAPMPEDAQEALARSWQMPTIIPKLPKLSLPKLPRIKWTFFRNLSASGKFFFISFTIFFILFLGNLFAYGIKLHGKTKQDEINAQAQQLSKDMNDAKSALIYENNSDALKMLAEASADFTTLQKMSETKASEFKDQLATLENQINKVSIIAEPKVLVELKHEPTYLNRSSIGILLANQDSNSLSLYDNTSVNDYFLLNSIKTAITGIADYTPAGVVVSSGDNIYHIDTGLKQFEPIVSVANGDLIQTKTYGNNLYTLNKPANQIIKIIFANNKYTTSTINAGNLSDIRDFGLDKDIYLLYPDKLIKVTNDKPQAFTYPELTDPITNATKIFVGSNLYILEANKKRIVILNKNGQLLNQIYFPNTTSLFDLAVDEAGRNIYLLGDNKLYTITF